MARVMVDTFLEANRGIMPEAAWQERKAEWTYEISQRSWEKSLREINDDPTLRHCIYVADDTAAGVVGLATGRPVLEEGAVKRGEVGLLYIRHDHQRQGIGRRFVQAVVGHLAQWGLTTLQIKALKESGPARRFYEALGGQMVGEMEELEDGISIPLVVYAWSNIEGLIGKDASNTQTEECSSNG
jgi:GNAT superfamily N-acetyltransferase